MEQIYEKIHISVPGHGLKSGRYFGGQWSNNCGNREEILADIKKLWIVSN